MLSAGSYDIVVRVTDKGGLSYDEKFTVSVSQAQAAASTAGAGNDDVLGTAGADKLFGFAGNDILRGLGSGDVLDGGLGIDTASYFDATGAVTASLTAPNTNTGDAAGDVYVSIEGLRGTRFNDVLTGDAGVNMLNGGPGADILDGGPGSAQDNATYHNAGFGLTASLFNPGLNTGEAAGDVYISIERLRGTGFDDFLQGDNGNNQLEGGAGNDNLDGMGGFDFVRYNFSTAAVTVSLANPAINSGDAKGDTFLNIEALGGTDFNDRLIGDVNNNVLVGSAGADQLIGGGGFDTASYATLAAFGVGGVVASLANPSLNTGDAAGDSYSEIEALSGSIYADTLIGDENNNNLGGDAGDDILVGGSADGSDGSDFFDGGDGVDMVSYAGAAVGFTASLANSS